IPTLVLCLTSSRCSLNLSLFPYTTLFRSFLRGAPALVAIEDQPHLASHVERGQHGGDRADGPEHVVLAVPGLGEDLVLGPEAGRSEEHTSELQSRVDLVCRLLLET